MQYMEATVFIYIHCTAWNQIKNSVQNICHDFQVYMQPYNDTLILFQGEPMPPFWTCPWVCLTDESF